VCGEGQYLAPAVLVEQIAQVVAAVGDIDLGSGKVCGRERGRTGPVCEELGRLWKDLHEALRSRRRRPWIEFRLGVDDRCDQRGIEPLRSPLLADDVGVRQREV